MFDHPRRKSILIALATPLASGLVVALFVFEQTRVDFVRDVEPILRENCFECHGPEEQEAGLRFDSRSVALRGGDSGPALEPGHSDESLLIDLVTSTDEEERMPQEADPLGAEEIAILRAWIDQGAEWPQGFDVVLDQQRSHWAYIRPERPELPSVEHADWPRNEIDRFVLARMEAEGLAPAPPAERARLLRRVYLDLVGLPPGLQEVDAFLADESSGAYEKVVDRLLASPHYGERWAIPWLDAARYADSHGYRLDNLRPSWRYRDWVVEALNRDVPFDQFSIEQIAGDLLPDATQQQKIATGFHRNAPANIEAGADPEEYRVNQVVDRVNVTGSVWLGTTLGCAQCHNHKYDPFSQREYYELFAFFNNTPVETALGGPKATASVAFTGPWLEIDRTPAEKAAREDLSRRIVRTQVRLDLRNKAALRSLPEWKEEMARELAQSEDFDRAVPQSIVEALMTPEDDLGAEQQEKLEAYYLAQHPSPRPLREQLESLKFQLRQTRPDAALVMVEGPPRQSHVLRRGSFLDPREPVAPATPAVLHPMPEGATRNRLGLAHWLVSPENPLVARVAVNRAWAELFGRGIVATPEDFGTRGEPPTHPMLIDWLAVDFMSNGWSMKRLHRQIVLSATYRQSSRVRPEVFERDPLNALYTRGPRFRLGAELIRDNALAVSGLLDLALTGPPVYPPQPAGFWRMIGVATNNSYVESTGPNRYRRGLYTIWRRSSPYPSFTNFDAPDRASSCMRRPRTNTALQALTLLNDPVYVEAAFALARRILSVPGIEGESERIRFGLRLALAREPTTHEVDRLARLYREEIERFRASPQKARALLDGWSVDPDESASELAAWFFVANALLNLDETITRG